MFLIFGLFVSRSIIIENQWKGSILNPRHVLSAAVKTHILWQSFFSSVRRPPPVLISVHISILTSAHPNAPHDFHPSTLPMPCSTPSPGRGDLQPQLDSAMQDVTDMCLLMEETEKQAVRRALVEERGRFCTFIGFLQPVVVRGGRWTGSNGGGAITWIWSPFTI